MFFDIFWVVAPCVHMLCAVHVIEIVHAQMCNHEAIVIRFTAVRGSSLVSSDVACSTITLDRENVRVGIQCYDVYHNGLCNVVLVFKMLQIAVVTIMTVFDSFDWSSDCSSIHANAFCINDCTNISSNYNWFNKITHKTKSLTLTCLTLTLTCLTCLTYEYDVIYTTNTS